MCSGDGSCYCLRRRTADCTRIAVASEIYVVAAAAGAAAAGGGRCNGAAVGPPVSQTNDHRSAQPWDYQVYQWYLPQHFGSDGGQSGGLGCPRLPHSGGWLGACKILLACCNYHNS